MKILNVIWTTSMRGTIGIALTEDETTGEKKIYCSAVDGYDECADSNTVVRQGGKIDIPGLKNMIKQLEKL